MGPKNDPDHRDEKTITERIASSTRNTGPVSIGVPHADLLKMRHDVKQTLVRLGFKAGQAGDAVDAALEFLGGNVELEELMREALKRAPKGAG